MRSLDVGLTVTDPDGRPVADAAATVAAVDEGICSLTGFATPDPLAFFTAEPGLGVSRRTCTAFVPECRPTRVGGDAAGPGPTPAPGTARPSAATASGRSRWPGRASTPTPPGTPGPASPCRRSRAGCG